MHRLFLLLKKRGVTLAEAMVMIILAGSCMVPIIGALDQGINRTFVLELSSAMQNIAESTMNELTYEALYQGVTPVGKSYIASYPSDAEPDYQFLISVEVVNGIDLNGVMINGSAAGATAVGNPQHSDLIAVSVVVSLVGDDEIVQPACLLSMLCPPPPPPDLIYAAIPSINKIAVINPMNHQLITEFSTGAHVPVHLAVHPGGRWLAIKTRNDILMMNIDPSNGGDYLNITSVYADTNICPSSLAEPEPGNTEARNYRGLVFRPDGKYLYFANNGANKLVALTVPDSMATGMASWGVKDLTTLSAANNTTDMKMLEDGTLVVALRSATNNKLLRVNTHTNTMANLDVAGADPTTSTNVQLALAGSRCGNYLYGLGGNRRVWGLRPYAPTDYITGILDGSFDGDDTSHNGLLVSPDNRWLIMPEGTSTGVGAPRLYAFRIPQPHETLMPPLNLETLTMSSPSTGHWRTTQIALSPFRKEFITKTNEATRLLFPNFKTLTSGSYLNHRYESIAPAILDVGEEMTDVTGRVAEYAWIATSNGTSHKAVCLDIYGGNTTGGFINREKSVTMPAAPAGIAVNAGGDYVVYVPDMIASKPIRIDCSDSIVEDYPGSLVYPNTGNPATPSKSIYLLDGSLLSLTRRESCSGCGVGNVYPSNLVPGITDSVAQMHNGFVLYAADNNGDLTVTPAVGFVAMGASNGYRVRDAVAMNQRNGAYVLMSREDNADAILVWVEKTSTAGYSGVDGVNSYKVMGCWQTVNDGIPARGRPMRLALSVDDKILAIYDPKGRDSKQIVRFYDLNNQHFPTTSDLAFVRYRPSGYNPGNAVPISNTYYSSPFGLPINPKKQFTRLTTLDMGPASNPTDINNKIIGSDTFVAIFGNWHHDAINHIGLQSSDAIRYAQNGTYLYRTAKSGTREPWEDDSAAQTFAYSLDLGSGSTKLQLDMYSWGDNLNGYFGLSNAVVSTSWADKTVATQTEFRPFQFRPPLICELLLDGSVSNLPDLADGADSQLLMTFMRDRSHPGLIMLDQVNKKLYCYNIFDPGIPILVDNGGTAVNFAKILPGGRTYNDMCISPDGRRLLIAAENGTIGEIYTMRLDYRIIAGVGEPGKIYDNAPTKIAETDFPAKFIAARPFNGYSSLINADMTPSFVGATLAGGYGSHRAAVGDGGIYVFGGSAGIEGDPNSSAIKRITASSTIATVATLSENLKDITAVPYDDKIMLMAGMPVGEVPTAQVAMFDPKKSELRNRHTPLQSDDNTENTGLYRHAAAATPYGPMVLGGIKGAPDSEFNFNSSAGWDSEPNSKRQGAVVAGSILTLGADNTAAIKYGSYFLNEKFIITPNTSFYTSFKTIMRGKDGITFCVQNMANNALGGTDAALGYKTITPSLAVWIDSKNNDAPPAPVLPLTNSDFVGIAEMGNAPLHASADYYTCYLPNTLGSANSANITHYWWVVYDGVRDKLNVWSSTGTNPELADWVVKDYPAALDTITGGEAWIGFTGASNDATTGLMQVENWTLKVWEKVPAAEIYNRTSFPDNATVDLNISRRVNTTSNSGVLELTNASNDRDGAAWYKTPFDLTKTGTIETQFVAFMSPSTGMDGMAFVMQSAGLLQNSTSDKDSNGYKNITNSIAFILDTRQELSDHPLDPNDNHLAIHKGGNVNTHYRAITSPGWDLNNGIYNWVWVEYDNPANNLRVYISPGAGAADADNPGKPSKPTINHVFATPLRTILGSIDNAYIGFTARTPTSSPPQIHAICRWQIASSELPTSTGGITAEVKAYYPDLIAQYLDLNPVGHTVLEPDAIRLTANVNSQKGAIWTRTPITVANDTTFSTSFVVNMSDGPATPADGMAFVVQGNNNTAISALAGLGLGYGDITNSLIVEFDCWLNAWDSNANHIALVVGGDHDNDLVEVVNPAGLTLNNGDDRYIWIDYDGPTNIIKVYISDTNLKPASTIINYTLASNLTTILGGSNAYFGFTAATEGSNQNHRVKQWELSVNSNNLVRYPGSGETLSVASLPVGIVLGSAQPPGMMNGTAVSHYSRKDQKWYLYYIGGGTDLGQHFDSLICRYNFDNGAWTQTSLLDPDASNKRNINFFLSSTTPNQFNRRTQVAACSWGDEIFIFGGTSYILGTQYINLSGIAYNPDTGSFRNLISMAAVGNVNPTAVPYGPYIYLIGGSTGYNGTSGTSDAIWRFKP